MTFGSGTGFQEGEIRIGVRIRAGSATSDFTVLETEELPGCVAHLHPGLPDVDADHLSLDETGVGYGDMA